MSIQCRFGHSDIPAFQYWIQYQADVCIPSLSIGLSFGHSNYLGNTIFTSTSAWVLDWAFKYHIRLIHALTHWVFSGWLAAVIIFTFWYSIPYQANVSTPLLSIQWRFGHSDHPCISIPDTVSGWCMHSLTEYWVELRPLWLFVQSNIPFHVRLMYLLPHWVFSVDSATSIILPFKYRIEYQADPCTNSLSIGLSFGYSDSLCNPIFNLISG